MYSSQSLLQSSVANPRFSLQPSGEIDTTNSVPTTLPLEIWDKIFNCLGFQDLKLFTEHKVKVLKKPLDGSEDANRLMIGEMFIFYKEGFLNVVESVYTVALCCTEFYGQTKRERELLINAAQWARVDKEFLMPKPMINKQDQNTRFIDELEEIKPSHQEITSLLQKISVSKEKIEPSLDKFIRLDTIKHIDQAKIDEMRELASLQALQIKLYEEQQTSVDRIRELFEQMKVNENKTSTEQGQPSDSNDEGKCVIQ